MKQIKPLIILDFSHTSSRMLFSAINQSNPKKINGEYITSEYADIYKHLMFNSLQYIKNLFRGELVLALDSRDYWRKHFYSDYKGHRSKNRDKSEINYDEYYQLMENVVDNIKEFFPFKVIRVDYAEADDIGGALVRHYQNQRDIILVTSDHDWIQNSARNNKVKMFDPIKKEFQKLSDKEKEIINTPEGEMSRFTLNHVLSGDSGDNVPNIKAKTKFSDNFISFLKENEIMTIDPLEFNNMSIKDEIIEKYNIYKIIKSGKRKGEETDEKDIYKTVPFGPKTIEKVAKDENTLIELLNENKLYMDNFKRNNILVNFDKIPDKIIDNIIKEYKESDFTYNPDGILEFFKKNNLNYLADNINKFYDASLSHKQEKHTSLDDFF